MSNPIPASSILPVEALVDPQAALARYLDQPAESIQILSVQSESAETIKVRYLLLP